MSSLTLNPKKTAVVLIDLQQAIAGRDVAPHSAADVIARSKQIADAFRTAGSPIVFVNVDINRIINLPADEPFHRPAEPLPAAAMEIVPAAGMQPSDILLTKPHWGAFAGTDLEQQLRALDVDTIILTGIATNMGVESTLRQGTGLGFSFVIVEDACSTFTADMQNFAFKTIFPRLGHVRTTAEVVAAIAS